MNEKKRTILITIVAGILAILTVISLVMNITTCSKTQDNSTAIEKQVSAINRSIEELEAIDLQLQSKIAKLEATAEESGNDIENIKQLIDDLKAEDLRLQNQINELVATATALSNRITQNATDISAVTSRLESLEKENEALKIRVDCLSGKHVWDENKTAYSWADDLSYARATRTCKHCNHTEDSVSVGTPVYKNYILTAEFDKQGLKTLTQDVRDASSFNASQIKACVTYMVSNALTPIDVTVKLPSNADTNVFRALKEGIDLAPSNGTVNLTVSGATKISTSAFYENNRLLSVTVGEGVAEIGGLAFSRCPNLKTVVIPDGVQSVGESAFSFCSELKSVTLGNTLTVLQDNTFASCKKLTDLTLSNSLTYINNAVFSECIALTSVNLPDSVQHLGNNVFFSCSALKSVVVGKGVTKLENSTMFYSCTSLTDLSFKSPLTKIDQTAFNGLDTEQVTLSLAERQKEMVNESGLIWYEGNDLLVGGTNVTFCGKPFGKISVPVKLDASDMDADEIHTQLSSILNKGANSITINLSEDAGFLEFARINNALKSYAEDNSISLTIRGAKRIAENAFSENTKIKSFTFGTEITTIDGGAFYGCEYLFKVYYLGELQDWLNISFTDLSSNPCANGADLYFNDKLVENVVIPFTNLTVNNFVFSYCTSIKSVTISEGIINIGEYAFNGCVMLKEINISNTVTTIGKSAFSSCPSLKSITIPASVRTISESAFDYCTSLKNITLSEGLTNIERNAFNKTIITSIVLPNSVTTLGDNIFYNCSALKSVTMGTGITSLSSKNLFYGCSALENVIFKSPVSSVQEKTFDNFNTQNVTLSFAKGQKELTLNDKIWTESDNLIMGGTTFVGKTFRGIVPTIEVDATTLTATQLQTEIEELIQLDVTGLTVKLDQNATLEKFTAITNAVSSMGNGTITLTIYGVSSIPCNAFENVLQLKCVVIGEGVLNICDSAFKNCTYIADVTLGNDVTTIGNSAFADCSNLANLTFGNGELTIGENAFKNCSALTEVTLGVNVTQVGATAFDSCSAVSKFTVDENNENYKTVEGVLYSKDGTTLVLYPLGKKDVSFSVPDGVTNVNANAFKNCTVLQRITVEKKVISIGENAFSGCNNLKKVYLLGEIEDWCNISFANEFSSPTVNNAELYFNNTLVEHVVIPDTITRLNSYLFYGCSSISSVYIGSGVTFIGEFILEDCANLRTITVDENNAKYRSIDGNLLSKDGKFIKYAIGERDGSSFVFPDGVTEICAMAFKNLTSLEYNEIPSSVTVIGESAFENCSSLIQITLGENVRSIGDYAFSGCSSATKILFCGNNVSSIGDYAFSGCTSVTQIDFNGTMAEWNAIEKGSSWNASINVSKILCSDGEVLLT